MFVLIGDLRLDIIFQNVFILNGDIRLSPILHFFSQCIGCVGPNLHQHSAPFLLVPLARMACSCIIESIAAAIAQAAALRAAIECDSQPAATSSKAATVQEATSPFSQPKKLSPPPHHLATGKSKNVSKNIFWTVKQQQQLMYQYFISFHFFLRMFFQDSALGRQASHQCQSM